MQPMPRLGAQALCQSAGLSPSASLYQPRGLAGCLAPVPQFPHLQNQAQRPQLGLFNALFPVTLISQSGCRAWDWIKAHTRSHSAAEPGPPRGPKPEAPPPESPPGLPLTSWPKRQFLPCHLSRDCYTDVSKGHSFQNSPWGRSKETKSLPRDLGVGGAGGSLPAAPSPSPPLPSPDFSGYKYFCSFEAPLTKAQC